MYITKILKNNKIFWRFNYNLLSIVLFFNISIFAFSVQAENIQKNNNTVLFTPIQFEPPPDGKPPDTSGGGTRDPNQARCSDKEQRIIPLTPKGNFAWTLQEIPSIYIYLPKTSAKKVVLAFQDETEEYHETAFLPINSDSRVVSFSLPKDRPSLAIGKNYKWKLTFVCNDIPDVEDPEFEGWVKRIDINSVNANLKGKTSLEQAYWYANNGYWYDSLMVLFQARQANPNNTKLNSLWLDLLNKIKNRYNTDAENDLRT